MSRRKARWPWLLVILGVVGLWAMLTAFTFAQQLPAWDDLLAVLTWVAVQGGAPIVVNFALAWAVENWPAWHNFPAPVKFWSPLVASVLLTIAASATIQYIPGVITQVAPYWRLVVLAILAWVSSQSAYMLSQKAGYGATAKAAALGQGVGQG